jgi:hypothetical protein
MATRAVAASRANRAATTGLFNRAKTLVQGDELEAALGVDDFSQ